MRVLVISYLFPNSCYPNRGTFVLNRLKAVQQYAEVKVINPVLWFPFCSRLQRYKDYDRIPAKETIDGIEVFHPRFLSIPVIFKGLLALTYTLAVLPVAARLRKSWDFDVIDLHWTYPDLPAGRWLAWLYKLKQLVTVRGTPALHMNERSIPSLLVNRLLARSDQVITLSDELKDLCIERGVAPAKVRTIRNGVDSQSFHHLEQGECRRRLGLPANARIVLGAGYLTPRKGFDRIIDSFPELLKVYPDAELYLIGQSGAFAQGDRTEELKQQARQLGLEDRVHFVGEVANRDLVTWYNAADCFCLSSRSEGCPNVLMEALACGCPVVATNVGAVAELVDESAGLVVPSSTEGVRAGLLAVFGTSYDRPAIAAGMQQYDWDWCARQVMHTYQRLLDNDSDAVTSPAATTLKRTTNA
jgi:teichuronic acid biosynthesis glycosyltransferase TuaC